MTELKTLKDFEFGNKNDLASDCAYYDISNKLRQEAIKWIKHDLRYCDYDTCGIKGYYCRSHQFWMERFNITDEELEREI